MAPKNRFKKLFLASTVAVVLIFLFANTSFASSLIHQTTEKILPPQMRTAPQAHHSENAWIYTKRDQTGYFQVYFQFLDNTLSGPDQLQEVALTASTFNKFQAQWGGSSSRFYIHPTTGGAVIGTCHDGQFFYYLGDTDPTDNETEIYMGCIKNFPSSSPQIAVDIKLTSWDVGTSFDIVSFDAHHTASTEIYSSTMPLFPRRAYPLVFITSGGELHALMHSATRINLDATNITSELIAIDYTDPFTTRYDWQHFANSLSPYFESYKSASLDVFGNNIVFLGKPYGQSEYEIGMIHKTGFNEARLTSFNQRIANPRFYDTETLSPNPDQKVEDIFFEVITDSRTKLADLKINANQNGLSGVCNFAFLMTGEDHSRQNLKTRFLNSGALAGATGLLYEFNQNDSFRDIYLSEVLLPECSGTAANGSAINLIAAPMNRFEDQGELTQNERQLTCNNDNFSPGFLANIAFDADFQPATNSPFGNTDVIFYRNFVDDSGSFLGHIYNVDEETAECLATCIETDNGEPITDSNGFDDNDGSADFCEFPPEDPEPMPSEDPPVPEPEKDLLFGVQLYGGACSLNTASTQNSFGIICLSFLIGMIFIVIRRKTV